MNLVLVLKLSVSNQVIPCNNLKGMKEEVIRMLPKQLRQLIAGDNDQLESTSSFVGHCAHLTFNRLCNLLFSLSFLFLCKNRKI